MYRPQLNTECDDTGHHFVLRSDRDMNLAKCSDQVLNVLDAFFSGVECRLPLTTDNNAIGYEAVPAQVGLQHRDQFGIRTQYALAILNLNRPHAFLASINSHAHPRKKDETNNNAATVQLRPANVKPPSSYTLLQLRRAGEVKILGLFRQLPPVFFERPPA